MARRIDSAAVHGHCGRPLVTQPDQSKSRVSQAPAAIGAPRRVAVGRDLADVAVLAGRALADAALMFFVTLVVGLAVGVRFGGSATENRSPQDPVRLTRPGNPFGRIVL